IGTRWSCDDLKLTSTLRSGGSDQAQSEQTHFPVLSSLQDGAAPNENRRGRAEGQVLLAQEVGIDRCVAGHQSRRITIELKRCVPPVSPAIPTPVPGCDEDVPGLAVDDCS